LEIPDDVWTNDRYGLKLEWDVICEVLSNKHPQTGKGPSNIGYGDLVKLVKRDANFGTHLTILLNDITNGKLPMDSTAMQNLNTAVGVALMKANGKPRPICVRETILNLGYAAISRQEARAIKEKLTPFDFGFRVSNGSAIPPILTQSLIDGARKNGEQLIVIKLDIRNAYGSTFRSKILEFLKKELPQLVRSFLVTYRGATKIKFPNMDGVDMTEGLIQGDPMAPAYAQLMYSSCCSKVRNLMQAVKLIMSFFDDITIVENDFDLALEAVLKLQEAFSEIGCEVEFSKSVVFATRPLSVTQRTQCEGMGLNVAMDGLLLLGSPVGTPEFIQLHLQGVSSEIHRKLEMLSKVEELGFINKSYEALQGLYQLVRDCCNQLGKHLLRTINPKFTIPAFTEVDDATTRLVAQMFDIMEITSYVATRISLPGSLSGLGIIQYRDVAYPAFLSCRFDIRKQLASMGNVESTEVISDFAQLRTNAIHFLGNAFAELIPSVEEFFEGQTEDSLAGESTRGGLQKKLTWKRHEENYERLKQEATGTNKSILILTSSETSSDFLFAPISKRRFRMYETFKPSVQFFLGLPVTSERCTLGKCDNERVIPNGEHAKHVGAKVIGRHNLVRDGIGMCFKQLHTSGQSPLVCEFETYLSELGYDPKVGASDPSDARCDFYLRNPESNRLFLADVRVTHPNLNRGDVGEKHLVTAMEAYKQKMDRYIKNYDFPQAVVKPLIFETYGGWHDETKQFLREIVKSIAGEDNQLFATLWMDLRYRVATALGIGQAKIIMALNAKQRSHYRWLPRRTNGTSSSFSTDPVARSDLVDHTSE
jgi:hypothetical protein